MSQTYEGVLASVLNGVKNGKTLIVGGTHVANKKDDSFYFYSATASKKGRVGAKVGDLSALIGRLNLDKSAKGPALLSALTSKKFTVNGKTYAQREDGKWDLPAAAENPNAKRIIQGLDEGAFLVRVSNFILKHVKETRSLDKFTVTERTK